MKNTTKKALKSGLKMLTTFTVAITAYSAFFGVATGATMAAIAEQFLPLFLGATVLSGASTGFYMMYAPEETKDDTSKNEVVNEIAEEIKAETKVEPTKKATKSKKIEKTTTMEMQS